jgi:Zn-dependent peptidase ImmA (M78 family)
VIFGAAFAGVDERQKGGQLPKRHQAEESARRLLQQTWYEDLANCPLPIDSFFIAEQLGLEVERVMLEPDVSGMLMKESPDSTPIVFVNAADHPNRQRFSCAHEIGHYAERLRTKTVDDAWGYIDRRGPSASHGKDPSEIHANQFAAALLMPAERVRGMVDQGLDVPRMALEFGVSVEAMKNRLDNVRRPVW